MKRFILFFCIVCAPFLTECRAEDPEGGMLIIDAPEGPITYPNQQLFEEKNRFVYDEDFGSDWTVTAFSCGTLDFGGLDSLTFTGAIQNISVLQLTGVGTLTLTNVPAPGSLRVDSGTVVRLPASGEGSPLSVLRLYGSGTLSSPSPLCVSQLISPSWWSRSTVTFLNDDGSPSETVLPAATSGSTLTVESESLSPGASAIFAPYVFCGDAAQTSDLLVVHGTFRLEEGMYIQPMLSEALRSTPESSSGARQVVLKADTFDLPTTLQQYAWGDMTSESFSGYYDRPDEICSPIVYRIFYDESAGEISIQKEFTWCGNYVKQVQSGPTTASGTVTEVATLFNEMIYQGTTYETNEEGGETLYFLSDLGILRQVAQAADAATASRLMREVSAELYFSQFSLTAYNAVRQATTALEQMSLAREYHGLGSRLGRCADGDPELSEKREHYDPFFAQFEGDRSWFAWATPSGTWLNRSPSNPISQPLGYKYNEYGINAGIARTLGTVTLGLSVGWQDGTFDGKETPFTSEQDSFQVMLLGAWYCGHWWADGWLGYQHVGATTQRASVAWSDCATRYGTSDYTLQGWSGGFNLGYQWDFPLCSVSPSIGFHFGTSRNGEIWDSASLTEIGSTNRGLYEIPLGVRFSRCFRPSSDWVITPSLKTEWIARFGDTGDEFQTRTYAYTGSTGAEKPTASGYYLYCVGAEIPSEFHTNFKLVAMRDHWLLGLDYDLSLASDWSTHLASGTLGFTW